MNVDDPGRRPAPAWSLPRVDALPGVQDRRPHEDVTPSPPAAPLTTPGGDLDRLRRRVRDRWPGRPPTLVDGVVVALLALWCAPILLQLDAAWQEKQVYDSLAPTFLAWTLVALFVLPYLFRRDHPALAAAVVVLGHVLQLLVLDTPTPGNVTALLAMYWVARWGTDRRIRSLFVPVAVAGSLAAGIDWSRAFHSGTTPGLGAVLVTVTLFGIACLAPAIACWLLGALVRQQAQSREDARRRAEAVEAGRLQNVRLAAQEERARIAREMHDVVAHSLSVVVVQADGAAYALDRASEGDDPTVTAAALRSASAALATIGQTARESLSDTRRLVAVLRQDTAAEYAPTGGVDSLTDLVDPLRAAGLEITTDITGRPRPLSRGADLAAYRVVQEALTNVIKHVGHTAHVQVSLDYLDTRLLVTVRDDGPGVTTPPDGHGHGLIGMRERVLAVGGSLWAGGAPGGGFVVEATIPYDAAARTVPPGTRPPDTPRHPEETR